MMKMLILVKKKSSVHPYKPSKSKLVHKQLIHKKTIDFNRLYYQLRQTKEYIKHN